jgi:SAM-dependent methyltransferase
MLILDLAAGWGRTGLEWARRGFSVTAFDLSPELVALGRERAEQAGLAVTFAQGTVREVPDFGTFDAVCAFYDDCLLSFEDEADNRKALRRVARALRPGGGLLFGTTDCAFELPPVQTVRRWQDRETVEETITFDAATRIGTSVRLHFHDGGRSKRFVRRRRHYTPEEAAALLVEAGLCVNAVYCGYDEALQYGSRPEGMVLVARRATPDEPARGARSTRSLLP